MSDWTLKRLIALERVRNLAILQRTMSDQSPRQKFTLEIEIGPNKIETWPQLADELQRLANRLRKNYRNCASGCGAVDRNGNEVGQWWLI